ncbi:MAG: hypothetical protein M3Y48_22465 [Actinomycetota bacterium]|nr:hypothetical protein [Actinomycetota bacterium]
MAAEAASLSWAATPDDQGAGSRIEFDVRLVGWVVGELETSLPGFHHKPHVRGVLSAQAHVEVLMRGGIVLVAAPHQDLAEDTDRVLGQIRLT